MPLAGTEEFIEELLNRKFLKPDEQVIHLNGVDVDGRYFSEKGFDMPIIIAEKEGLRITVPDVSFSIPDVAENIGLDHMLDVIDVTSQCELRMTMGQFAEYFYTPHRSRLLNVLSLEFSTTKMAGLVEPPHVVSELSLIERCWPPGEDFDLPDEEDGGRKPSVQKYCLMSMAGSYTDFHIDFGGSSVWYHVLWGEKIFYLIPPTVEHLCAYKRWYALPDNRGIFFGDFLKRHLAKLGKSPPPIYKLSVRAGHTVLLPSGWIHSVYTPDDSLVFGGNFLHALSIPLQLTIYRLEKKLKTDSKFLFPYFEKLHWYVGDLILDKFKNYSATKEMPPKHYLEGGYCLAKTLNRWLEKRKSMHAEERSYFLPERHNMSVACPDMVRHLRRLVVLFGGKKIKDAPQKSSRKRSAEKETDAAGSSKRPRCDKKMDKSVSKKKQTISTGKHGGKSKVEKSTPTNGNKDCVKSQDSSKAHTKLGKEHKRSEDSSSPKSSFISHQSRPSEGYVASCSGKSKDDVSSNTSGKFGSGQSASLRETVSTTNSVKNAQFRLMKSTDNDVNRPTAAISPKKSSAKKK